MLYSKIFFLGLISLIYSQKVRAIPKPNTEMPAGISKQFKNPAKMLKQIMTFDKIVNIPKNKDDYFIGDYDGNGLKDLALISVDSNFRVSIASDGQPAVTDFSYQLIVVHQKSVGVYKVYRVTENSQRVFAALFQHQIKADLVPLEKIGPRMIVNLIFSKKYPLKNKEYFSNLELINYQKGVKKHWKYQLKHDALSITDEAGESSIYIFDGCSYRVLFLSGD